MAQTYVVQSGDTLSHIAKRHGVTLAVLRDANRQIKDPNRIRVGDRITIPAMPSKPSKPSKPKPGVISPPPPEQYVVRQGDTLGKIASAFGVSLDRVLAANPQIKDKNRIRPGQLITIPGKSSALAVTDPGDREGEPKWLAFARRELGTAEIAGGKHNQRILEYHATTTLKAKEDEVHWCSSFVNWCIRQSGLKGTDSARARDWLKWGKPLSSPRLGAITVFSRGAGGHVGFFLEDRGSTILVLGGNQSDKVSKSGQKKANFLGYRWPAG